MNRLFLFCIMSMVVLFGGCETRVRVENKPSNNEPEQSTINLEHDYFIRFFHSDDCPPCQRMKRVWEDPAIEEIFENTNGIYFDGHNTGLEDEELMIQYYDVELVPTTIIIAEIRDKWDGTRMVELDRFVGYMSVDELNQFLKQIYVFDKEN